MHVDITNVFFSNMFEGGTRIDLALSVMPYYTIPHAYHTIPYHTIPKHTHTIPITLSRSTMAEIDLHVGAAESSMFADGKSSWLLTTFSLL